jgi:drug/metabolite transporter (DMT)-like permease
LAKVLVKGNMLRIFAVAAIGTLSGAGGQVLMRRGMQIVGPLESYALLDMLTYFWRSLCNPFVIGGTVLSGIFYFALLAALGWTGVTVAFPLTALEYAFAALFAVLLLNESVPPLRWAGIGLIIVGVMLVGASSEADARVAPGNSPSVSHTVFESHREGDPFDKTG